MLPTLVEGLTNKRVTEGAASETHTAAVTADGELFTWGRDRFGQVSLVVILVVEYRNFLLSCRIRDSVVELPTLIVFRPTKVRNLA